MIYTGFLPDGRRGSMSLCISVDNEPGIRRYPLRFKFIAHYYFSSKVVISKKKTGCLEKDSPGIPCFQKDNG